MRRHESLMPLTHDHHHALAQARRLREAAGEDDAGRARQTREFVDFFASETVEHFREEEEVIFPLVVEEPDGEPVLARLLIEHVRIHMLVTLLRSDSDDGGAPRPDLMTRVAALLEEHIRTEEKVLFPMIQELVPASRLAAISLPPRHRSTPGGG
jgi:iron-sulfur cluster repair protein YtfE (RIC family)